MKSSRRSDGRRSDGAKRDPQSPPRRPATPTMDGPRPDMPSEFIDLEQARPSAGSRPSQRSPSPAPSERKDKA
jgi:hypothetical protein